MNISCTANTTGFQDITFEWTVGQGLPILCSNNSNCSTEGGVSVLRREYSEGQINVSCTVHANDSTGTGGCVKTTRRSSLTVEGERGDLYNHPWLRVLSCRGGGGGGAVSTCALFTCSGGGTVFLWGGTVFWWGALVFLWGALAASVIAMLGQ